jgi:hypothetical protein
MAKDFHSLCDDKGPTVSFFKLQNGICIGGFASTKWQTPQTSFFGSHFSDSNALLFNLTDEVSYKVIDG